MDGESLDEIAGGGASDLEILKWLESPEIPDSPVNPTEIDEGYVYEGMCIYDIRNKAGCLGDHQDSEECLGKENMDNAASCRYFQRR